MFDNVNAGGGSGAAADGAGAGGGGAAVEDQGNEITGGEGAEGGDGEAAEGEEGAEGDQGAEAGEEGAEGEEADLGGEEGDDDDLNFERDGRKVDAKTRDAIGKLAKIDKVAAKAVRDSYFANQAVIKETGATDMRQAVAKIRTMNATIEALGGDEGITNLQTEVEDYRTEIDQFSNGDPALLNQLWEANPDATANMAAAALEMIGAKDIERLDKALLPTFNSRIKRAGLPDTVSAIQKLLEAGEGQKAYDTLQKVAEWLKGIDGNATKQLELKSARNPEKEALDRDRQKLNTERSEMLENKISADVNRLNNRAMSKAVEPFFKEMKLSVEGRREFVNGLQSKIWAAMKADKSFQMRAKAVRAKGDTDAVARFANDKFTELLPEMFRAHRNALYPSYATRKPKPKPKNDAGGGAGAGDKGKGNANANGNAGGGANGVVKTLTTHPGNDNIDWTKTSDPAWITGKNVFLKNGQRVNIDWTKVPR
jgi:hypothetical protein